MAGDATRHVELWALQITDAASYQRYREAMTPILHSYGGSFGYDFAIARVLASQARHPIDRVFTIAFPDAATADRFFADPAYLSARHSLFEPAVPALTRIASFDEPAAPRSSAR